MIKLEDNPPILYPVNACLQDICGQWWVAHTKARNEKSLAWFLAKSEIAYFLPLREKVTVHKNRRFTSMLPLFSGYLFFSGDVESRYTALSSNRIAQVIEVVDQDRLIGELSQIHRALSGGARLDPHPYLKTGHRCRVTGGPLAGTEGILIQKKNLTKLILQIEILGQAAAVEIDGDLLEPID
ncbi:MAG: hypothetical protein JW810_07475 [Sedimentisphaerales bacterium]|nr:hypothetical protein [Sedimentisphaerales bacterium]